MRLQDNLDYKAYNFTNCTQIETIFFTNVKSLNNCPNWPNLAKVCLICLLGCYPGMVCMTVPSVIYGNFVSLKYSVHDLKEIKMVSQGIECYSS